MADTALQKAIEQLSEYRDTYNPMCDEFTIIDKCIDELTDLLPYERETIEAAYNDGGINSKAISCIGISQYKNEKDYFTKTYQND
jgi:hypothetical protein